MVHGYTFLIVIFRILFILQLSIMQILQLYLESIYLYTPILHSSATPEKRICQPCEATDFSCCCYILLHLSFLLMANVLKNNSKCLSYCGKGENAT